MGAHARTVEQRSVVWRASVGVAGGSGCAIGEVVRGERQRRGDGENCRGHSSLAGASWSASWRFGEALPADNVRGIKSSEPGIGDPTQ